MAKIARGGFSKKLTIILGFIGLYLLAAGSSWAIFSFIKQDSGSGKTSLGGLGEARSKINIELPRTEVCPLNGAKYTEIERDIWNKRRPVTVIVENHVDSRPPSGLSRADVVYEAVAEGGITRFLAVFYCGAAAEDVIIAPVRSARIYFISWAAEYGNNPIFAHVGGANNICGTCAGGVKPRGDVAKEVMAVEYLASIGWRSPGGNALDTTYDSGYPVFARNYERLDHPVASEHTMVSSTDKIYDEASSRGFEFKDTDGVAWNESFAEWKFADDSPAGSPDATTIGFEFWSNKPDFNVEWKYISGENKYVRFNGGREYTDLNSNEQISAKNIVIMFVKERGPVDKELHMFYTTVGEGEVLLFANGTVVEGTWEKEDNFSRTRFYDNEGKEIEFVRGPVWIEAVPAGNEIAY